AQPPRHARNPYDTYRPSYEYRPTYEQTGRPRHAAPSVPPQARHAQSSAAPPVAEQPEPAHRPAARPAGGRAAARRAARAQKAAQRPEALRRLVPQALVVAFLAS